MSDLSFDLSAAYGETSADDYRNRVRAALEGYQSRQNPSPTRPKAKRELLIDDATGQLRLAPKKKKRDFNGAAKKWLTAQSLKFERVDWYDPTLQRAHDLMGVFDYLAFGEGTTIGVQVTSIGQMATRRKKMKDSYGVAFARLGGWKILLLGFGDGAEVRAEWL